jgi:DNA-binding beta-propeller fold protein YncE
VRFHWIGIALTAALLAAAAAAPAPAGEVRFAAGPEAAVEGGKVKITFTLSAATDVAVGVVDGDGVVVKHLAGGLLGEKAPEPLQAGSPSQTLWWDRTDDLGKPVPAGKYSVLVQAGLAPVYERSIAREPRALSDVLALAVGPEGELYAVNSAGIWTESYKPVREILVFSREMKYLRTILPCPGDLSIEDVAGIRPVKRADGTWAPRLYYGPGHRNYPDLSGRPPRQNMLVAPDGWLYFTDPSHRLLRIRTADGAVPEPFEVLQFFKVAGRGVGRPQLALARDGKSFYVGGLFTEDYSKKGELLDHAVYRVKLGEKPAAEVFAGQAGKAGSGKELFNQVHGVAVDGDGNVLVSDFGNDRVVVLSAGGKHLGEFAVERPDHLLVDRRRGTIYVISVPKDNKDYGGGRVIWKTKKLIKIRSWKDPRVLGEMSLAPRGYPYSKPVMALDDEADPPILYIGKYQQWSLSRIVDRDANGKLPDAETAAGAPLFGDVHASVEHLAVDPATERLYVRTFNKAYIEGGWLAYDGRTGEPVKLAGEIDGVDMQVGLDGRLYTYKTCYMWRKHKRGGAWLLRWDRDGKPVPFEGSADNVSQPIPHDDQSLKARFVDREGCHGFAVGPDGRAYVIYSNSDRTSNPMWMCVVGADGSIEQGREKLLGLTPGCCTPQVDRAGNIYVMDNAVPQDAPVAPADFLAAAEERYSGYYGVFGSVIRFPPAGGGVYHLEAKVRGGRKSLAPEKPRGKLLACRSGAGRCVVDNADWVSPHASPVPGHPQQCICFPARMSLDRYGRLFVPVAPARRIRVLDTAGNQLCVFGRYGNADNGGKEDPRPLEGVPLDWGFCLAASDRALYVSDLNNRRVVKVRLDYAASAKCAIP